MTQADVDAAQNRSEPEAAGQPVNNTTSGYAGATPAPGSAAQPAAASALPAGMTQADVDAAQNRSEPEAAPAAPAAPSAATPQAQQDAQNRSEPTAAGSKEQMASIMNMQRELGVTADGKIGPKTRDAMARKPEIAAKYAGELGGAKQFPGAKPGGSAAQPATKPGGSAAQPAPGTAAASNTTASKDYPADPKQPVKPRPQDPLKAQVWDSKYASGWNPDGSAKKAGAAPKPAAAQPAPTGKPPRYKTPAEFDKEIARFSKSADANLPPNARYIATLQAEKAALSGGAPAPKAAPAASSGTTTTQSNQSVQGTMKMGKPDGPITFNGKVVQPGAPEYAAASQALIQSQQQAQQARSKTPTNPALAGTPVQQGAVSGIDEYSVKSQDDAILERIRKALYR